MTKKWIAINLLLLALAGLLGRQLRQSILEFDAENNTAKIQPARKNPKQKPVIEKLALKTIQAKTYNPAEFMIIPEKNVFTESRSKEEKVVNLAPPEPPPLAQKPILVGITVSDTERLASIIDPGTSQPRDERKGRAQVKRIGDVYYGYTITEISGDRIVLESGTRREVIPLHEGKKRAQQGKTPILSTRIVPFGSGGVAGGTPVSVTGSGAPQRSAGGGSITTVTSPSPATSRKTAVPPQTSIQPAPPPESQAPSRGRGSSGTSGSSGSGTEGGGRVIRTPFGDIVRPAR